MTVTPLDPEPTDLHFLQQEFNRLRAELAGMKDKIGDNANAALDQIGAYLNGSGVASRLGALETELEGLACKVKGSGRDAVSRLEHEVGERPLTSLAIAFGVGLLVSQFFRRS